MNRVVIATAHSANYSELASITVPNQRAYASRHGYLFYYEPDTGPTEMDACKARIFLTLYETGIFKPTDWFLWIDTDALFMNGDIPVLQPHWSGPSAAASPSVGFTSDFIWAYDWNGPNSGVWLARFSSRAAHFVRTYDFAQKAMGWGDNWAMNQTMLLPPFTYYIDCIEGKLMNCNLYELHGNLVNMDHKHQINAYEPGDWILHLAGVPEPLRTNTLRAYASKAT